MCGMHSYVLSEWLRGRFVTKGKILVCYRCGEPLEVGDEVTVTCTYKKRYHRACFEELLQ